jgi:ribokinase
MKKILISGLTNIETTLQIKGFPLDYNPINYPFFGVNSRVSGVGYNLAKALKKLGSEIDYISLIGADLAGKSVKMTFEEEGLSTDYIIDSLEATPQSVILYDKEGKRQIHTDLKDIQDRVYPEEIFDKLVKEASILCLTNINFSRPFLKKGCELNKVIATDVHTIEDLNDEYNRDFMEYADILFMSDELLPMPPKQWVQKLWDEFGTEIIVIGLGSKGALLAIKEDDFIEVIPAVKTRGVVNTVGAGDSLFSCFVHCYNKEANPYKAIKKAIVFASYKIGATSASEGFLAEEELNQLYKKLNK